MKISIYLIFVKWEINTTDLSTKINYPFNEIL